MKSSLLSSALLMVSFLACTMAEEIMTVPTTSSVSESHKADSSTGPPSVRPTVSVQVTTAKLPGNSIKPEPQTCPPCEAPTPTEFFDMKNPFLLVIGGLGLGCVILLFTTMLLACQVCHLKRHPREYQLCPTDTSTANGKKASGAKPDEAAVMMSEVAKEDETETAKDVADDGQSEEKERKKNENGDSESSTGKTGATECDKAAETSSSDATKTGGNEAKQPEGEAAEATKEKEASGGAKNMADGTKGGPEGPAATEGAGSEA